MAEARLESASSASSPARGRPLVFVERDKLKFLHAFHFTWEDISTVSKNFTKEGEGLKYSYLFYYFDLDDVVRQCLQSFPLIGEALLRGRLLSSNIHVQ